jgi:hypothetical protein
MIIADVRYTFASHIVVADPAGVNLTTETKTTLIIQYFFVLQHFF